MARPKGSKNKNTSEQIDRIKRILSALDETLSDDIEKLTPSERVRLWASMQEFITPKYARMTLPPEPIEPSEVKVVFVGRTEDLRTSED